MIDLLRGLPAPADVMHLALHGQYDAAGDQEGIVLLSTSTTTGAPVAQFLTPAEVENGSLDHAPLVFLNACHSGQIDFALAGLGGWAEKMVSDIGVSAFIGTLWEVNDQLAAEFAVQFYDLLSAGKPLGEAFQAARQLVRSHDPANPTWLAYTLYADPNGKVVLGNG